MQSGTNIILINSTWSYEPYVQCPCRAHGAQVSPTCESCQTKVLVGCCRHVCSRVPRVFRVLCISFLACPFSCLSRVGFKSPSQSALRFFQSTRCSSSSRSSHSSSISFLVLRPAFVPVCSLVGDVPFRLIENAAPRFIFIEAVWVRRLFLCLPTLPLFHLLIAFFYSFVLV